MAWKRYSMVFRLLSPLHIGYRKVSNLQQTRGYVPGKVLWAALTARLTRDYGDGSDGQSYVKIGKSLSKHFRFTYLYPALDPTTPPCYPWDDDFAYRFLSSYASTALNYDHQSAAEGSLHEVEFIRPYARPLNGEEPPQVYLVGNLYTDEEAASDESLKGWSQSLARLQLGGERGYGWGRVQLLSGSPKLIDEGLGAPQVEYEAGETITAHALAIDKNGRKAVTNVTGPIEPLVGWERDNKTEKNWRITPKPLICYAPGAIISGENKITFKIGENGILEGRVRPGIA